MTNGEGRLPRFRRERDAFRAIELTPRDREIIRQVARFHFLRSTHIQRLVEGAPVQILRRLQALYHHGWLDRPRCQIDFFHRGGSRAMAYGLGSRGVALMRKEYDVPFSKMVWGRGGTDVGRLFLDHTLMVAEVLIAIERACRQSDGRVRFLPSEELVAVSKNREPFHWTATVKDRRIGLVPDAVFALEFADSPQVSRRVICCLEADRGTMPVIRRSRHLSSIARKLSAYAALWKAGSFEKRFGTKRMIVITVTTSVERVKTIAGSVAQLPYGQGLFASFTQDEVCADAACILERCAPSNTRQSEGSLIT